MSETAKKLELTVRDHFAMAVLHAIINRVGLNYTEEAVDRAYDFADAMLSAKENHEKGSGDGTENR